MKKIALAAVACLSLSGCAYGDLGYGGVSIGTGYGGGYYDNDYGRCVVYDQWGQAYNACPNGYYGGSYIGYTNPYRYRSYSGRTYNYGGRYYTYDREHNRGGQWEHRGRGTGFGGGWNGGEHRDHDGDHHGH